MKDRDNPGTTGEMDMLMESLMLTAGILTVSVLLNGLARVVEILKDMERERIWKQKI